LWWLLAVVGADGVPQQPVVLAALHLLALMYQQPGAVAALVVLMAVLAALAEQAGQELLLQ
jgi:hypothetical protein